MMLDAAVQMYMALISAIPIMIQELIPALGQIWDSIYENLVVPGKRKARGEMWERYQRRRSYRMERYQERFQERGRVV